MRLGGSAAYAVSVSTPQEAQAAYKWAAERSLPCLPVGSGSNIVWKDEGFSGLLIVNKILGFQIIPEANGTALVTAGAGEGWDAVVARCAEAGLTGIEALSLIPGTAGATPVQNVGAYGQEIANTLVSVEVYDTQDDAYISVPGNECAFAYRTSRFKTTDRGRFLITGITLRLTKGNPQPPFYAGLQRYIDEHQLSNITPMVIRQAVIAIRQAKLPDPTTVANNGSFFGNPIITQSHFDKLSADYPDMPHWPAGGDKVKLSAAWLIEQAGFKDFHDIQTGMATWPTQPLVLVNERATSTASLIAFRQKLMDAIQYKFNVTLEQEPELLP